MPTSAIGNERSLNREEKYICSFLVQENKQIVSKFHEFIFKSIFMLPTLTLYVYSLFSPKNLLINKSVEMNLDASYDVLCYYLMS